MMFEYRYIFDSVDFVLSFSGRLLQVINLNVVNWAIFMAKCQFHVEPSTENYFKEKSKEDVEKNIVISMVDMIMDKGTSHGFLE